MFIKTINNVSTCCYSEYNRSNSLHMESITYIIKKFANQICEEKKSAKFEEIVDKCPQLNEINERSQGLEKGGEKHFAPARQTQQRKSR